MDARLAEVTGKDGRDFATGVILFAIVFVFAIVNIFATVIVFAIVNIFAIVNLFAIASFTYVPLSGLTSVSSRLAVRSSE